MKPTQALYQQGVLFDSRQAPFMAHMGFSIIGKDFGIVGSILGCPYVWK